MVVEHLRACDQKGTDVRLDTGTLMDPSCWPRKSLDPDLWRWRDVLAFRWDRQGHINELECRAYLAMLLWRLRSSKNHCMRFLHLLDSMVTLGVVRKKRSTSHKLNFVVRQIAALELAGFAWGFFGIVQSSKNPADRPSRSLRPLRGAKAP